MILIVFIIKSIVVSIVESLRMHRGGVGSTLIPATLEAWRALLCRVLMIRVSVAIFSTAVCGSKYQALDATLTIIPLLMIHRCLHGSPLVFLLLCWILLLKSCRLVTK